MVKIILNMIVKNESKIIQRVMKSAFQIADAFSICDTGSTDDTLSKIEEFATENKVIGYVYNVPWINFGHNRTESFLKCRETCEKLGWNQSETYALLLDGDHILMVEPEFDKETFTMNGYQIPQIEHHIRYHNTRFIKLSADWKCVGVTHEYWNTPDLSQNLGKLEKPWIDDKADGGCKDDKFERDIRMLTQGLVDDPTNDRYMFYLAQSYKDNRQYEQAIEWFNKRINSGGWHEEVFYSMLQIGRMHAHLQDTGNCLTWYLKAYNFHPTRNEPLVELAYYLNGSGEFTSALIFAKKALEIPFPENDFLFIAYNFYHEVPRQIIMEISSKNNNNILEGITAANDLLISSTKIGENTRKAAVHFITNVTIRIQAPMTRVMDAKSPESIFTRMKIKGKYGFGMKDNLPVVVKDVNTLSHSVVSEFKKVNNMSILEFEKYGRTAIAKVKSGDKIQGAVFSFSLEDVIERGEVLNINNDAFTPFFVDGKLAVLHSLSPFSIIILNADNTIRNSVEIKTNYNFENFEVVSSAYDNNGLIYVGVRCIMNGVTLHRLIRFEKTFKNVKVSLPFVLGNTEDRLTSFSFDDKEVTFYLDVEDKESLILKAPIELLAKIY